LTAAWACGSTPDFNDDHGGGAQLGQGNDRSEGIAFERPAAMMVGLALGNGLAVDRVGRRRPVCRQTHLVGTNLEHAGGSFPGPGRFPHGACRQFARCGGHVVKDARLERDPFAGVLAEGIAGAFAGRERQHVPDERIDGFLTV
jgi:hypothetical protein